MYSTRAIVPKHYGTVTRAVEKRDGLWLLLKLDSPEAEAMHSQFRQHEYYARPLVDMEHLRIIEVAPYPSWPSARLKPYRAASGVDMEAIEGVAATIARLRGAV